MVSNFVAGDEVYRMQRAVEETTFEYNRHLLLPIGIDFHESDSAAELTAFSAST